MNWFTRIVGIVKAPFVDPVPRPVPADPAPVPVPTPPAPTHETTIAIRGNFSGVFHPMPVPLLSTEPVPASKLSKVRWRVEVEVLTGQLTVIDLFTAKLHSPKFKGVSERVYLAGEKFVATLTLGSYKPSKGAYSYTSWGIHTAELGEIVNIQAQVLNQK